jgi:Cyclic nucleotide-binding domain
MRLFGAVRWSDVRSLAGPVVETEFPAGAELMREGDVVATFSLIHSGSAELWLGARAIATLGPGDWFGESDPLERRPQAFGVVALSALRVLTFSAFGIDRLCAAIPGARGRILECRARPPASPGELRPPDAPGEREGPGDPGSGRRPAAAALAQRAGVENGDRPVVGGDPAELAHQPQRARDRLTGRPGPPRELILGQR